jgi:tetratricopeptide (TPR) repeat protein
MKKLLGVVFSVFLSSQALAAGVSISDVSGPVKIGRAGSWKDASKGMAIADGDFLNIPESASVTVKLTNGSPATFPGKAVIPGRRLLDPQTNLDSLMRIYRVYQKASEAIGGADAKTSLAGAGRGDDKTNAKLHMQWDGAETAESKAGRAAQAFDEGFYAQARKLSEDLLADQNVSGFALRKANLVLGSVLVQDLEFDKARTAFDVACAPLGAGESDPSQAARAGALVQRGKLQVEEGDDAKAAADFQEAAKLAPDGDTASEAHYQLMILAAAKNDAKASDSEYSKITATRFQVAAQDFRKSVAAHP